MPYTAVFLYCMQGTGIKYGRLHRPFVAVKDAEDSSLLC